MQLYLLNKLNLYLNIFCPNYYCLPAQNPPFYTLLSYIGTQQTTFLFCHLAAFYGLMIEHARGRLQRQRKLWASPLPAVLCEHCHTYYSDVSFLWRKVNSGCCFSNSFKDQPHCTFLVITPACWHSIYKNSGSQGYHTSLLSSE